MPFAFRAPRRGESVRIRGERWRIADVMAYDACAVIDCAGIEQSNAGVVGRFILPFEPLDSLAAAERPRVVGVAAFRRIAAAALAAATPAWRSLRSAAQARISLLPYQLEPALAMTRGVACRILLADEVGLGKTIQAGLLVAELLARERDARVLVVTPAGLRHQWRDELHDRFSIEAVVVDAAALAHTAADLPPGVNPWTVHQVAIASIDFLKRADVIRSLEPLTWDLVAFDEAHGLCGRSDRALAAELVAARARRVVVITATPHNGDDAAFERLRALGRIRTDEPLLTFRRSRAGVGVSRTRAMRRLAMSPTHAEARMHQALNAYAARVAREASGETGAVARLAMLVLQRRAASSAASLARSIERRLALLDAAPRPPSAQMRLPLDDGYISEDEEPGDELAAPGLADTAAEHRWLRRILTLAREVDPESKIRRLRRLLQRTREPALVFTEYRDTLCRLLAELDVECAVLHGGLSPAERAREAKRFTHGGARVLLATDAASEGLNLHHRCRLVINIDVPWTPLRLEQRVGRVDRLGQSRRVHAITFVARGTSDAHVASALASRAMRAERDAPFVENDDARLRADAVVEAGRLAAVRAMVVAGRRGPAIPARPVVTLVPRRGRGEVILALRLSFVDPAGMAVWETTGGVAIALDARGRPTARTIRGWFELVQARHAIAVAAAACDLHDAQLAAVRLDVQAASAPLLAREHAMLERLTARGARLAAPLLQPGLFDRRAIRDHEAQRRVAAEAEARARARLTALERQGDVRTGERELLFAVSWR